MLTVQYSNYPEAELSVKTLTIAVPTGWVKIFDDRNYMIVVGGSKKGDI